MANSWDKLAEESDESYARFLIYRNLGPMRSMRKAYHAYLKAYDGYTGGLKRLHIPGNWAAESRANFWRERAAGWDVRNLASYGASIAALHFEAVRLLAEKNLRVMKSLKHGDEAFPDLIQSLKLVAVTLTPEVVKGVQDRYKPDRPVGTSGQRLEEVE